MTIGPEPMIRILWMSVRLGIQLTKPSSRVIDSLGSFRARLTHCHIIPSAATLLPVIPRPPWRTRDLLLFASGQKPTRSQVFPNRISCLDEGDLFRTAPRLDLLLPRNRRAGVGERFKMNKPVNPVLLCEAPNATFSVLRHPSNQVVGHACVKVSRTTRQNVHAILFFHLTSRSLAALGMTRECGRRQSALSR